MCRQQYLTPGLEIHRLLPSWISVNEELQNTKYWPTVTRKEPPYSRAGRKEMETRERGRADPQ